MNFQTSFYFSHLIVFLSCCCATMSYNQHDQVKNVPKIHRHFQVKASSISAPFFLTNFRPLEYPTSPTTTALPTTTTTTMSPVKHLKILIRQEFLRKINICYSRFQRCSRQLSPEFCASPTINFTFYLWARNLATNIMEGIDDGHRNVKCSSQFVRNVLLREKTNAAKRNKILSLIRALTNQ